MEIDNRKMTRVASEEHSIASPKPLDQIGRTKLASYHAKLILGSYRADQANDPEIYLTAIAHLLSRYSPDIGAKLTDPKNGIAGKYKWLPTVSEVKEEADRIVEKRDIDWRRAKMLEEQFALRDLDEPMNETEFEQRRIVVERIRAELRDHGFQFTQDSKPAKKRDSWKRFSNEQLLAMYSPNYDLQSEQNER